MKLSDTFTKIYKENFWEDPESVSGAGSTIKYTEELRSKLPTLVKQFNIQSILDAPCGDFNWMKEILPQLNVKYTGGDIVHELVKKVAKKYTAENVNFITIDITTQELPSADLMICRDCLFHLHPSMVEDFFRNFCKSNIKYLLTTTHYNTNNEFQNVKKLRPGNFKRIDLFSHPYNLTQDVLARIEDYIPGYPPREMVLFERSKIIKRFY